MSLPDHRHARSCPAVQVDDLSRGECDCDYALDCADPDCDVCSPVFDEDNDYQDRVDHGEFAREGADPVSDPKPDAALVASNPNNQSLLDSIVAEGGRPGWQCPDCGSPLFSNDECAACWGGDDYGTDFCPVEEFCCGC